MRVLFQIPDEYDPVACTNADYNDFGEPADLIGYVWGHAGWDVQTKNVALRSSEHVPFYSLTRGKVIYRNATSGTIGIASIDPSNLQIYTTYYLHARHLYVGSDEKVLVGSRLGIQGNKNLGQSDENNLEHIHIEIHRGDDPNKHIVPRRYSAGGRWINALHGSVNADPDEGTGTLLRWHQQLNYLCMAATRTESGESLCPDLTPNNLGKIPPWPPS